MLSKLTSLTSLCEGMNRSSEILVRLRFPKPNEADFTDQSDALDEHGILITTFYSHVFWCVLHAAAIR